MNAKQELDLLLWRMSEPSALESVAARRAVVAPAVPQLTDRLTHDREIVFVPRIGAG